MTFRRWLASGVLVAVLCTMAGGEPAAFSSFLKRLDLVKYPVSARAPHFSGATVEARPVSSFAWSGKVVLVNFWASWCLECRPEMPIFERLHRQRAADGLAVVGINVRETRQVVARYGKELGLSFPLILDPDGRIGALYGAIGLPATFLIARDGRAVAFAIGSREWGSDVARAILDVLLAEPTPRVDVE